MKKLFLTRLSYFWNPQGRKLMKEIVPHSMFTYLERNHPKKQFLKVDLHLCRHLLKNLFFLSFTSFCRLFYFAFLHFTLLSYILSLFFIFILCKKSILNFVFFSLSSSFEIYQIFNDNCDRFLNANISCCSWQNIS